MEIGKKIAFFRNKMNMSCEELAARLFVSVDLVYKWETGKRRPDWTTIEKLADVFGVSAGEIADKNEMTVDELRKCLPSKHTFSEEELTGLLNGFLESLRKSEAAIFMRRYYLLQPVKEIAADFCLKENHIRSILAKTRTKLKRYLTERAK